MAVTTGSTLFNLNMNDLIEEAFERCGLELRTGYDFRTARRSLNLLTIEWANRGINLWTLETLEIPLVEGQITYDLPVDTIDLLDSVIRQGVGQNQIDINISRISESTYSSIPTKNAYGRPIQFWVDRQSGNVNGTASTTLSANVTATATTIQVVSTANLPTQGYINIGSETILYQNVSGNQLLNCYRGMNNTTAAAHLTAAAVYNPNLPAITVWPTPDNTTTYQFVYWRMRRIQDAGSGVETADMNFRFLPAVTAGLAYHIAMKVPELADRIPMLKAAYDEQFDLAAGEDREKAAIRFVPRRAYIGGG